MEVVLDTMVLSEETTVQGHVFCVSVLYVVKGLSVIMELGKFKKISLILLSFRIPQEEAVRQIWRMLSSQLNYKTDTMFHFLFCYRVVFLVIYAAGYLEY